MAGVDGFDNKNPILDDKIDNDGGDEQEVNTTGPFQPGAASTPYHGGEQIQMQTMPREQSGLPDTSYAETPLLGDYDPIAESMQESSLRRKMKKAVDFIKGKYPNADFEKLKIRRGKGEGLGKIVAIGPKGGQYKILKEDESGFTKNFLDNFKSKLGPAAEEVLAKEQDTLQEQRQRLEEAEKQQREAEKIAAEREKESRDMENLRQQTERVQAGIDALQEEQGSNLESEAELRKLKQLKKNHHTEFERKKKEVAALEKQAKNKQRAEEKVSIERAKLEEVVRKRNLIEERLNSTKPLDDLNQREAELRQKC